LQAEGKKSQMTLSRIQELESLGFEWNIHDATWENYLSELADYRKIHGHCNVFCSQNAKLAYWVRRQRKQYQLLLEGKKLPMTLNQIQQLESLGIDWKVCVTTWQDRLSELADYRKIHGHCNVPQKYPQLGSWVETQRGQYRMHLEGKASKMTTFRIKALESLGFEWHVTWATWEDRLSELADYRKIHGNCNVPRNYNKNVKLATWVGNQRAHYRWKLEGKTTWMTLSRIQELDSMGFEWKPSARRGKGAPKKPSLDNDDTRVRKRAVEPPRLPRPAHEQQNINSLSHAVLLVAAPRENDCLVAARRPANPRQGAEIQLETAQSNEMLRTDPVAAEPPQQRHEELSAPLVPADFA
jgi:hypothetical protein